MITPGLSKVILLMGIFFQIMRKLYTIFFNGNTIEIWQFDNIYKYKQTYVHIIIFHTFFLNKKNLNNFLLLSCESFESRKLFFFKSLIFFFVNYLSCSEELLVSIEDIIGSGVSLSDRTFIGSIIPTHYSIFIK